MNIGNLPFQKNNSSTNLSKIQVRLKDPVIQVATTATKLHRTNCRPSMKCQYMHILFFTALGIVV